MKLNIYIMHSDKINYKEDIYKPLLEKGFMKENTLILPMTKKFESTYIKELLKNSDIVICDLTKNNIFLKTEIKMAIKLEKEIYYLINSNDKNKKKYKNINIIEYIDKEDYCTKVYNIISSLNKKELILKRDNIYCLGKIK